MSGRCIASLWRLTAVVLLAGSIGASETTPARASPFEKLEGSWRGAGTVSPLGGKGERVRCRVSYRVSGDNLTQKINCAGTDYRITASSDLTIDGTSISGSWQETSFGVGGDATGLAKGGSIFVRISSEDFSGRMSIQVAGDRQTVRITQFDAGTGEYVTMAAISLSRQGSTGPRVMGREDL